MGSQVSGPLSDGFREVAGAQAMEDRKSGG